MRPLTTLAKWFAQMEVKLRGRLSRGTSRAPTTQDASAPSSSSPSHIHPSNSRHGSKSGWLPREKVRIHVQIIGFFYTVTGVIILISAAVFYFFLEGKREAWFRSPADLVIVLGIPLAGVLALIGIAVAVTGIQFTKLKEWTPPIIIVLSCISAIAFPIGTLWFGYCLWVLTHKSTKVVFDERRFL
jgi:hypothetical protein